MKVFVSIPAVGEVRKTFIDEKAQKYLEERFEVTYSEMDRNVTQEEFKAAVGDAEAVITGWGHVQITGEMVDGTKLKYILHTGGSVGSLVAPEIYDMGIRVISGNPIYAESVAEGTICYMLMGLRKSVDRINLVRAGGWQIPKSENPDEYWRYSNGAQLGLLDRTVGIISLGAISRYLIEMLKVFHVKVKVYSGHKIEEEYLKANNLEQVSLNEIFSTCDIVSVHSAMTEKTRGMIGKEQFDLLKDGALFVNTARGRVIKEDEMIEALKENRFNAVLDVYYHEPLEQDSALRKLPNVLPFPHNAGPTTDRRSAVTMRIADTALEIEKDASYTNDFEVSKAVAARMTVGG